ncbi:hypothetical protein BD289DRAFT_444206 [Coniella lustricola]|uniref:Tat pathway signal sequence n=1 Tax=Coniella lustricola TaxID=2025994 RepID=A0A2T2ZW53_9PEZI|nr:hypothetical protein BD289DRAFT_444206 [Coniella lustricola]
MAGSKVEEEGVPHRHGHHEPETLVQHSRPVDDLVYTPAEDILELRVENYYIGLPFGPGFPVSKYQGWPDDEKDKLWMKYWDGNHMRVNQSIARKLPHLSIHAPIEGHQDEYLMGIMAFHHLHCLSALRKYIYPRRYNASIVDPHTGAVNYEKWHHLDHCVEILRQSIECRPDTTARTFRWHPGGRMIPHEWVTHTCRNFDALQSWASEATVSVSTRTHVVDGVIVDDEGKEFPVQFEEIRNREPDGWAYTVDDL